VRDYRYDDRDELVAVREPGRLVENWFDTAGRVVRQEVRNSDDDPDPYVATVRYVLDGPSIIQTDFDEGDGVVRYRYNRDHYVADKTLYADSPAPVTFTYNRAANTNLFTTVTMSCVGQGGRVTRSEAVTSESQDSTEKAMMRTSCVPR